MEDHTAMKHTHLKPRACFFIEAKLWEARKTMYTVCLPRYKCATMHPFSAARGAFLQPDGVTYGYTEVFLSLFLSLPSLAFFFFHPTDAILILFTGVKGSGSVCYPAALNPTSTPGHC